MAIIEKNVLLKALSYVIEPDLKRDIVSLGLVNEIKISEKNVSFSLAIKNNALHNKNKITTSINHFIKKFHNDPIDVTINFSVIEATSTPTENLDKVKHIIAITSGKGGVGKSTVSSNLAVSLEKMGFKVGLVDADIYGPSIPSMFNVEEEKPRTVNKDNSSMKPIEAYGIKLMSIGFFGSLENAVVWRGPMAVKAIKQILYNTYWGELDYLLIDLPPGTGDIHLSLVQLLPLTGAVIVSTPQKIALIDAIKAINMFKLPQINVPILGIVENMSYFTPKELPKNKYYIFGKDGGRKVAHNNNITLLGEIPIVQSIREASDSGRPAGMQEKTFSSETFKELAANLNTIISKKTKADKSTPVPITHKKGCS